MFNSYEKLPEGIYGLAGGGTALQLLKVPTSSSSRRRDGEQLLRQVVHFGAGPLILTDVSQDLHLGNSPDF